MEHILVTGGAGYIGSHMVYALARSGYRVTVLDDLSGGFADAIRGADLVVGSIGDAGLLNRMMKKNCFTAVINFASFIQSGESVRDPLKYYINNVGNTLVLLRCMRQHGVERYIFSSTAATFGEPLIAPIDESHPQQPINPYGQTKLVIERVLADMDRAYGFKSVCLRYFNAAGADPEGNIGERHDPETHLIPLVLQVANRRRSHVAIFGDDYNTPDGTCIRDYVHVQDLCTAHLLALKHLLGGGDSRAYNLGTSAGFSVRQVIEVASHITGREITARIEPRRLGDPARLVADSSRISAELGWRSQRSDLETIVADAWRWELQHPWRV